MKPVPKPAAGTRAATSPRRRRDVDAAASAATTRRHRRRLRRGRAGAAPRAAAGRRHQRARRARRDQRRHRGVHEPRRAAQELAAEALSRSATSSRRSSIEHSSPTQPLPFTLRTADDAIDRDAERRALRGERRAGRRAPIRRPSICASSIATAPAFTRSRSFISIRRRTSSAFARDGRPRATRAAAGDRVGPGGRRHRAS